MNRYNIAGVMAILALAMLLVGILVVACGPDVQPARESGVPADAPAPADTPVPRVDLLPWSTPIPTIAFIERPGMDIQLTAEAIKYEKLQAEGGASGQAEPELILVQIFLAGTQERDDIAAFLAQHGVEHSRLPYKEFDLDATVPVSLLTTLAAHPSFGAMERIIPRYPNLSQRLNKLAAWYEAGMMPEEDINPSYAELLIGIEGDENYDKVRQFLKDNGAVMGYEDADADARWKPTLVAFVPVPLLPDLAGQPGVKSAFADWYPVPEEYRFTQKPIGTAPETPAPTETPPATGESDGASGAAAPTPSPTPAASAIMHGSDGWHAAGIKGQGVKVGIIDVGNIGYYALYG